MELKKIMIGGIIALSFMLVILSVLFFIDQSKELRKLDPLELEAMTQDQIIQTIYDRREKESTPFYFFIPIFGFFGVGIGATLYYIFSRDVEKKEKIIKHNSDVILKLLNPDEKKVIKKLIENQGRIQQVEITYMEGYTKVKAHRVIEGLVKKDIVTKEAMGKVRLIKLDKDLYEILKKN